MEKEEINKLLKHGIYKGELLNGNLIETHISWVILTKEWAFKIKKPIKYPFLDFSTLEKRKFYCERELQLNQRLTDIYHDVLPIRYHDGFSIGGKKGSLVDYTVRMKKLQASKKMDKMLIDDKVRITDIQRLAEKIAVFHSGAEVMTTPFDPVQTRKIFNDILDIMDWAKQTLERDHLSMIKDAVKFSNSFLDLNHEHIALRIHKKFKRDVHGDLHAKNIFLYRDPVIFDCIEFNDNYRQIDLLNEVAFFCMELEAYGHWELSSIFMKKYLSLIPCLESGTDQQLFLYYKFYRASVKAKVNALRAIQAEGSQGQNGFRKDVIKYLDLMAIYRESLAAR